MGDIVERKWNILMNKNIPLYKNHNTVFSAIDKLFLTLFILESDMPEIQEEAESAGKISPLKSSSAKTKKSDIELIAGNARNFQLSILYK